nr:putative leucine-rich repeat receptor-like serine/threonine-protein kinase At2g24130 [Nicotiana tomentosiformis]
MGSLSTLVMMDIGANNLNGKIHIEFGNLVNMKEIYLGSKKISGFDLECEVLRHRNLVKVISSCANLDYKALVLEYMPNRNLDALLYSHNKFLDLIQRLKVMIGVAFAMEYLHEGHSFVVVHCDLKPGNILWDEEDMVARIRRLSVNRERCYRLQL